MLASSICMGQDKLVTMGSVFDTDVLVIGGGAAGSFAAIRARERGAEVLLVTKGFFGRDGASTWMAGPATQAALYPPDSPQAHAADVIRVGRFMADQELVYRITERLPGIIRQLAAWGVRFQRNGDEFVMGKLPGASHPRSVVFTRDAYSGPQYRKVLPRQVRQAGIRTLGDVFINDLVTHDGAVVGAVGLDLRQGRPVVIRAKSVVLATGGCMGCYPGAANPMATGDGIAMAYRSGAEIADMEFTDFYAYGCVWPPVGRGEGWPAILVYNLQAVMRNNAGREFMKDYSGARRVPPKAVALELAAGRGSNRGGVFLSVNQLPPEVVRKYLDSLGHQRWLDGLKERDFDLTKEAVEIAPFPITSFGGCRINHRCETSVEGLYAAGEAASGHQGAYVMVGNMVGSSSAMGCIAGENAAARADRICHRDLDDNRVGELFGRILKGHGNPGGHRPVEVKREVARILRQYAYVIGRNEAGLRRGIEELASLKAESLSNMCISDKNDRFNLSWVHALEAVNQVEVAHLIMTSALERTESRGCHFRDDHPDENPQWNRRIVMSLDHGKVRMSLQPVQFVHLTPPVKQA